jgi:hypothetical protein
VRVYSSGSVLIKDAGEVLKSISTAALPTSRVSSGGITVEHDGDLEADQLNTSLEETFLQYVDQTAGDILCDGNGGGSFQVKELLASTAASSGAGIGQDHFGGDVTVREYTSVTVSNVDLSCSGAGDGHGGSLTVSDVSGDIAITGEINLGGVGSGVAGSLDLQCSGAATIAEIDMDCVDTATIFSGGEHSHITGALTNFDRAGNEVGGALDATAGQTIHYDASVPGNAYLREDGYSGIYPLKSGGILTFEGVADAPTVIVVR